MKYQGSKARIAKYISPIINRMIVENNIINYVEPFVGGANMIEHIKCKHKYGVDNNKYLIAFLEEIKQGWNPLEYEISKEVYDFIKKHPEAFHSHIVALAGFCASYNSKWFGGYAGKVKTKIGSVRNYYDEAVRNVLKQADKIKDVVFYYGDYKDIKVSNALIYCDPPYQNTTGYKDKFNHKQYWEWCRKMSKDNIVLCSEYKAPDDFECIWEKEVTTTLDKNSRSKACEKLFIVRCKDCQKQTNTIG